MENSPSPPSTSRLPGSWPLTFSRGPRGRRRDIVETSDYQLLLDTLITPCVAHIVGTGPSVLDKSPLDHILDKERAWARIPYPAKWTMAKLKTEVPPGHVRVRFFIVLNAARSYKPRPDLEAVLPLEENGDFDLGRVKRLWGLETCAPIDPVRWKAVEPGRPDTLSPVAVHNLSQFYGAINVFEPSVSERTLKNRLLRVKVTPHLATVRPRVDAVLHRIEKRLDNTALAEIYDKSLQDARYFDWCFKQWLAELSPWQRVLLLSIVFAMIFFFFSVTVLRGPHAEKVPVTVRWATERLNLTDNKH